MDLGFGFITLRIYKVLKPKYGNMACILCFITLRIYKVLKLGFKKEGIVTVLSH